MNTPLTIDSSSGHQLQGTLYLPEPAEPPETALLLTHGHGSNSEHYQEYAETICRQLGMACLAYDLSGHGANGGSWQDITVAQHLQDVQSAYDRLRQETAAPSIYALGSSYGSYLSALLASDKQRPLAGLVLRAPAIYPDSALAVAKPDVSASELDHFRRSLTADTNCLPLNALRTFEKPVLLVRSEHDQYITQRIIAAYQTAGRATVETIDGAAHGLSGAQHAEFEHKVIAWLVRAMLPQLIPEQAPRLSTGTEMV